jgi:DNA-binding response OmpR family regulator
VESAPGDGSTFTVYLPRAKDAAESAAARPLAVIPSGTGEVVLVVEDDADVLATVAALLRRNGYGVIEASDGEEGMRLALEHRDRIGVVLSDVTMPRMNGHELASGLRISCPELRVILMTGYDEGVQGQRGGGEMLFKPFRPHELLDRIRSALAA